MTKRISKLCSHLQKAKVFADVGCDHGYCTQYVLQNGLCERAYITDISAGSLEKAKTLLKEYIEKGSCIPLCADGLDGTPEPCDLVLIAGMGGEEIVHILSRVPLPKSFVLQPMKNSEKVREFLLSRGAKVTADYTFQDGKYYDVITGYSSGGDSYTDYEIMFGRDNLKNPSEDFLNKMREEHAKMRRRLTAKMNDVSRAELLEKLKYYEEVLSVFEYDI